MWRAHRWRFEPIVQDEGGSTAVEFALVATAMCLVLFGSIEFSRMMWTQSALNFAVQEAARCASVTPATCGTSAQITAYAAAKVAVNKVPASAFTSTTPACGHKVTASYAYPIIATRLFPERPTLAASACFP